MYIALLTCNNAKYYYYVPLVLTKPIRNAYSTKKNRLLKSRQVRRGSLKVLIARKTSRRCSHRLHPDPSLVRSLLRESIFVPANAATARNN